MRKYVTLQNKGAALFVAMMLMFAISVVTMSSMTRSSETTALAGKELQNKRTFILNQSATRIELANLRQLIINIPRNGTIPQQITRPSTGWDYFPNNTAPQFAYRSRAIRTSNCSGLLAECLSLRYICYEILVDVREVVTTPGTWAGDAPEAQPAGTNRYWGESKSTGVTSCFRRPI